MGVGAAVEGVEKLGKKPGTWLEERDYEIQGDQMLEAEGARQQSLRTQQRRSKKKN